MRDINSLDLLDEAEKPPSPGPKIMADTCPSEGVGNRILFIGKK